MTGYSEEAFKAERYGKGSLYWRLGKLNRTLQTWIDTGMNAESHADFYRRDMLKEIVASVEGRIEKIRKNCNCALMKPCDFCIGKIEELRQLLEGE